jgi:hypothetical protein
MTELASKVEHLVAITLGAKRAKDRELGAAVHAVMGAYDAKDEKGIKTAIRLLDAGLLKAQDDRSQQILRLAIGVLVEAGAPPELAWPTAERGLVKTLAVAARFADACMDVEDTPSVKEAVERAGREMEKKMPREAAAWESIKSRALLAVACLSHSPKLRAKLQKSGKKLLDACYPLEEDIESLMFLRQVARVLPDQTMLAIHPGQRRGFRVEVKEVATNLELYVLLADAIIGDPAKGFLEGRRPSAKAINALKDPDHTPKTNPEVPLPFHIASWTALKPDGSLPDSDHQRPANWYAFEGVPLEIPPFEGERVMLLQKPSMPRALDIEASFAALTPRVTLKAKLSGAEVDSLLLRMGKAAVKAEAKSIAEEAKERLRLDRKWEREAKRYEREMALAKPKRKRARG